MQDQPFGISQDVLDQFADTIYKAIDSVVDPVKERLDALERENADLRRRIEAIEAAAAGQQNTTSGSD